MGNSDLETVQAALIVIWKKIHELEKKMNNGSGRMAMSLSDHWNDLQREAAKVMNQIR